MRSGKEPVLTLPQTIRLLLPPPAGFPQRPVRGLQRRRAEARQREPEPARRRLRLRICAVRLAGPGRRSRRRPRGLQVGDTQQEVSHHGAAREAHDIPCPPSPRTSTSGNKPANSLRGQYSDAVLNELESQNESQVEGILGKVRILKDVSLPVLRTSGKAPLTLPQMTHAIGDEIRDSSALAEKMNDSFDSTRIRLRGTMNRMLLMAERSGVGWKVWLGFFAAVALLFMYVWLF